MPASTNPTTKILGVVYKKEKATCLTVLKEQLKIMAGVEFMDVGLGYLDVEDPVAATVVQVPEHSDDALIPGAVLPPGHVFAVGRSLGREMAVYRLENKAVTGELKFHYEGLVGSREVRDSMQAAFKQFSEKAADVAPGMRYATKDYLLFLNDLQGRGASDQVSLAEFVGLCSAA